MATKILIQARPAMEPDTTIVDVQIDVYCDGRFVRSIRLDPASLTQTLSGGAGEPLEEPSGSPAGTASCFTAVELPRNGRLRLAVDLRWPPPDDGRLPVVSPRVTSYSYDADGRVSEHDTELVTGTTYEYAAAPPLQVSGEPPDQPHIAG